MLLKLSDIRRLMRGDEAQDLLEYGMLAALIALVAFAGVGLVGNTVFTVFWQNIAQAV
jgi:Flp pilus assembly pilin Flp